VAKVVTGVSSPSLMILASGPFYTEFVISEIDPEIWVNSPCRSRNFMASFLYKFRGELMFCMGITSSQFHPDKILGEMYFTQDFLKDDFCFQINFTQRAQFRTSHAFPAKSEIARRRK
jgi:hypothetical protein